MTVYNIMTSMRSSSSGSGMLKRITVGIVGFGAVARIHVNAYRNCEHVEIVSVADNDAARLEQARGELDVSGYASLQDLLRAGVPDVVCVLTPPASHEVLVCVAAQAGAHVLCEKPMSLSVAACERMIEVCKAHNVRLGYGASYRYLPALQTAREMILRGDIGEVRVLREYAVGQWAGSARGTLGFGHYPKGGPGGSGMGLCDHGIHLIDVFPWLMDSVTVAASGRGNIAGEPQGPEYAHLEYANGAVGQLLYEDGTFSTTLPGEGAFAWGGGWNVGNSAAMALSGAWNPDPGCIHVHGSSGSLRIYHYANLLYRRAAAGAQQIRVPDRPMPQNFALQLEAFVEALRNGAPVPVPGEVGLEAVRTLLGIYEGKAKPLSRPSARRAAV
jgi:UDP-N-acetyl-2-amino-2-deoxyglucuronate dehydrogenase